MMVWKWLEPHIFPISMAIGSCQGPAGSSLGPGTGIRQLRHQHALWQRQDLVRATLGQKSQQHGAFGVGSGSGMFFDGQMFYRHLLYSASFGGYKFWPPHMGSLISENGFI